MTKRLGFVCVFALALCVAMASVCQAALNSTVVLPGYRMGYNTNTNEDGSVNLSAYLSTTDHLSQVSVYASLDSQNQNRVWISASFNGEIMDAFDANSESQSLQVNRSGIQVSEYISLNFYQEDGSGKGIATEEGTTGGSGGGSGIPIIPPVYPWWSNGHVSITMAPFTALSGQSNYYEYEDSWDQSRHFTQHVSWYGEFGAGVTSEAVAQFAALSATSVPEPSSVVVFLSAAALFVRRR